MLYFDDMILRKRLLEDSNEARGSFLFIWLLWKCKTCYKTIDIKYNHSAFDRGIFQN